MRISDWSSDVCSSDLGTGRAVAIRRTWRRGVAETAHSTAAAGADARDLKPLSCARERGWGEGVPVCRAAQAKSGLSPGTAGIPPPPAGEVLIWGGVSSAPSHQENTLDPTPSPNQ